MATRAEFPDKLGFLFSPYRYKVAHGGRGSGKSWGYARALILQAHSRKMRVLCTREVQKSIKDSVHKLLSDQIEALGLSKFFTILETQIRGKNGSEFFFSGLSNQTSDSIKSFEGVDRVWVEEAQSVSKKSWDVLIPTIRKDGSEVWITFNPEMDTDETYTRFVMSPAKDSIVVEMNYTDNPWFPKVLESEREHCLLTDPEGYENIWLGKCKKSVAGAIYANEIDYAITNKMVRNVPHDSSLPVHCVFDLGWADSMAVIFVQKSASELRIIDYIEDNYKTLDWYVGEARARYRNIGEWWLPHDGEHRDFKTGKSSKEILEGMNCNVEMNPRIAIEDGIRHARMIFKRCYFDQDKAARLLECLKRYRRSINAQTLEPGAPLHDASSHGADCFRYLGMCADQLGRSDARFAHPILQNNTIDMSRFSSGATRAGY